MFSIPANLTVNIFDETFSSLQLQFSTERAKLCLFKYGQLHTIFSLFSEAQKLQKLYTIFTVPLHFRYEEQIKISCHILPSFYILQTNHSKLIYHYQRFDLSIE